jgi:hypothetical protein
MGLTTWILLEVLNADSIWPPQLVGLLMSMAGMITGSLLPNYLPLVRQVHKTE